MKLNDNGDFCLLYVEQADEKQNLFETIGMQSKPVVLILPLVAGQFRSRLFQRPEDFSDLKHLKRQTGVSVIFITSGSELLAQMATRYGFAAYPSLDALAESLERGRRSELEESEASAYKYAGRRARTGPLVPSASQLDSIRRSFASGPLPPRTLSGEPAYEPVPAPAPEPPWQEPASAQAPVYYFDFVSMSRAPTSPLHPPVDLGFWPTPDSLAQHDAQAASAAARRMTTPIPPVRDSEPLPLAGLAQQAGGEEPLQGTPRFSQVPPRRSATLAREAYNRQALWEAPEQPQPFDNSGDFLLDQPTMAQMPAAFVPPAPAPQTSELRHKMELPERPAPPVQPPAPRPRRRSQGISPVLLVLSLLILGGAALGSLMVLAHAMPSSGATNPAGAAAPIVGTIAFISSGQVSDNTSQGIDDEVQISLHDLNNPKPGKSYYAWLLGDSNLSESQSIPLGKLNFNRGAINLLYQGNDQHANLLQIGSRFLITEEDSAITPILPSPDPAAWRYYGVIPSTPDASDPNHFSFLNHLRHLLADEPVLDQLELPGGLNNWFSRNSQKLMDFTTSARDEWQDTHNMLTVRQEAIRILSYLDGMSFIAQDMPQASINAQVDLDTHLAGLGLVNVMGATQTPASYMEQIVYHLNGLLHAPGSPANVRGTATTILPVLSNTTTILQKMRDDDKKLLGMDDNQLNQQNAFALLNDMVVLAGNAYTGSNDPATGQYKQGIVWVHQQLQSLATINISPYAAGADAPDLKIGVTQHPAAVSSLAERKSEEGLL